MDAGYVGAVEGLEGFHVAGGGTAHHLGIAARAIPRRLRLRRVAIFDGGLAQALPRSLGRSRTGVRRDRRAEGLTPDPRNPRSDSGISTVRLREIRGPAPAVGPRPGLTNPGSGKFYARVVSQLNPSRASGVGPSMPAQGPDDPSRRSTGGSHDPLTHAAHALPPATDAGRGPGPETGAARPRDPERPRGGQRPRPLLDGERRPGRVDRA